MNHFKLRRLITIALFAVISFLIMYIAFPLPLFPPFLTIDFSDIPAIIGALVLGPGAGITIEAIKNLLHWLIIGDATGVPIGELANFIAGLIFILVSNWIYRRKKTMKNLVFGLVAGTLVMTLIMSIANYYIIFPSYALFLHFSIDQAVGLGKAANSRITDLYSLIVYGIAPFNIIKGILISILLIPLYLRLNPFMKSIKQ